MKYIHFTLFLTTLSLAAALTGPKLVSGTLGGAVTIRCQYHAYYKCHVKYLCKGSDWKSCSFLANSSSHHKNIDDRIIMVDNKTAGEFITKVTQLSANDTGIYWCGIMKFGFDKMVPVQLNVAKDPTTQPPTIPPEPQETVHRGNQSSVNISILLGSIFGVLIVTAVFVIKCRKYSAAGKKGISHKEEEYNAVCNSVSSRDDEEDKLSGTTTDKSSTQTQETFRDIHQTPDHEEKENFSCQN
ncbi:CMRF35-like molecule 1 [Amblyraja radiata]|uniref:CMRF35-like molecule 1 n=1 Tax=Amblyraja radiata TaxID=386614 RepID=UPI0014025CD1|nr:CMRF35-like molecule 1 [Amblyraja radiata]